MRKSYKYILLNAAGLLIAGSLASCSETDAEKDRGSAPVIKYAACVTATRPTHS